MIKALRRHQTQRNQTNQTGGTFQSIQASLAAQFDVAVSTSCVCHAGKHSVVGFAASKNDHCTEFYSDLIVQQKGQEIVKKDLDRVYGNALEAYRDASGNYPERIIIYRDGLSEQ